MAHQRRDVLAALLKRGEQDRKDVDPVPQILAEGAVLHHRRQIAVGGRHDPHVDVDRGPPPHALDLVVLQHAQEPDLRRQRQFADLALLAAYPWPGNIRELGAVIDRAAILGGGRSLAVDVALGLGRPSATPPERGEPGGGAATADTRGPGAEAFPSGGFPGIVPLADAMRAHIERALAATAGRIEGRRGAAAILAINPHTLRARMRKLGIDPRGFRD